MRDPTGAKAKTETFKYAATILTAVSGATALFFTTVVAANVLKPCDVPLNLWLIGAVCFSLPATYAADQLKKQRGFQATLWFEVALLVLGFLWMSTGSVMINMSTTCEATSPVVWWTVFVTVSFFWSWAIGGIFFLLAIVLVPMLLAGRRAATIPSLT